MSCGDTSEASGELSHSHNPCAAAAHAGTDDPRADPLTPNPSLPEGRGEQNNSVHTPASFHERPPEAGNEESPCPRKETPVSLLMELNPPVLRRSCSPLPPCSSWRISLCPARLLPRVPVPSADVRFCALESSV